VTLLLPITASEEPSASSVSLCCPTVNVAVHAFAVQMTVVFPPIVSDHRNLSAGIALPSPYRADPLSFWL
jgi:hypothetical protein